MRLLLATGVLVAVAAPFAFAWFVSGFLVNAPEWFPPGMDPEALIYGSVEQVAEQFHALAELGYTDVIVRNLSHDQAQALACIERLADVASALR